MRGGKDDGGFTLIEVLVALGLLTLLFSTFVVASSTGITKVREAKEEFAATAWAQDTMEALRVLGFAALPAAGRYDAREVPGAAHLPARFSRGEVIIVVPPANPTLKEVTVAIFRGSDSTPAFALTTLMGPHSRP
jgi:prepilin-type N-terminal cleavage/methylation domain-containing protein